jgi:periplasmic copper chaperone A
MRCGVGYRELSIARNFDFVAVGFSKNLSLEGMHNFGVMAQAGDDEPDKLLRASECRKRRQSPNCNGIRATARELIALIWMATNSMARGGEEAIKVVDAWVPAHGKSRGRCSTSSDRTQRSRCRGCPLRVRCPVANFSERHTVDRGEVAPAMRMIPSIPLAGGSTTVLKPDGYHVMLLETRQPFGWRTGHVVNRLPEGRNNRNGGERP